MHWQWFINLFLMLAVSSFAQQTADTLANTKTKQILAYIAGLPQQNKMLSGQFAGYSPDTFNTSIMDQITQQIGQTPGILGCDYACGWDIKTPPSSIIDYSCNPALKNHWNLGGLVTINMHLPNPVSANGGGYNNKQNLNFADLINMSTTTGQRWQTFLDRMVQGIGDLQQSGVTVLFRPFHEMNGDWFYWGSQDPQTFKNVWINMFNYLTNTNNLHNILWVYSPDQSRGSRTLYYPGSAYVDIVALDAYLDDPTTMSGYSEMIGLNKTFALGEIGPSTVNGQFAYTRWTSAIETLFPKVAYFQAWNDGWAPLANQYPCAFYNHHRVVNRDGITLNNTLITTTTTTASTTTVKTTTTITASTTTVKTTTTITASTTTIQTTSTTKTTTVSSTVIYNFSNGVGQWLGYNVVGSPWESNEFTYALTDSLKADIQLSAGSQSNIYTNQVSTFTFAGYQRLVGRARFAPWGVQSGGTIMGKLYIKTGSSWTWYDSGAVQLNNSTATQVVLHLNTIPTSFLADIREVGIEYTSSAAGSQTSVYLAYVTAEN